jgi:hypothetical protein
MKPPIATAIGPRLTKTREVIVCGRAADGARFSNRLGRQWMPLSSHMQELPARRS